MKLKKSNTTKEFRISSPKYKNLELLFNNAKRKYHHSIKDSKCSNNQQQLMKDWILLNRHHNHILRCGKQQLNFTMKNKTHSVGHC